MERCTIRIDRDDPTAAELRGCFSRVFREQDASPRPVLLTVSTRNSRGELVAVDVKNGNPVFLIQGRDSSAADFRGRWLADHELPLVLNPPGLTRLVVSPTDGNRLRFRRAKWWERWFR